MKKEFLSKILAKKESKWLIVMVGHPLVGKSSFIENHLSDLDFTILSSDDCLMEHAKENENYLDVYKRVSQKQVKQELKVKFRDAISAGSNCVIDMTSMGKKSRTKYCARFKDYFRVCVKFDFLSNDEIEKRNNKRFEETGKFIPMSVIDKMKENYRVVTKDEGWDLICH